MSPPAPATLLVFTLGPGRERGRRRLLPPEAGRLEQNLYRGCFDVAVDAGRRAGCRIAVSTPDRVAPPAGVELLLQRGGSFGARLRDAISRGARQGSPLVVVGTDVPGLRAAHVTESLERLAEDPQRVVLGPSPDGGVYLLAWARPIDRELARVRWCRRDTLRTLLAALADAGRPVVLLAPLADLDRRADLERWLAERHSVLPVAWRGLARRLRALLARLRRPPVAWPIALLAVAPIRPQRPRGPPL